jgi:hypothetical protein
MTTRGRTYLCMLTTAQGVTQRCRLSWLTNSALIYEPKCGGGGSCGVSANECSCTYTGAQINFEDLTPYLTYAIAPLH